MRIRNNAAYRYYQGGEAVPSKSHEVAQINLGNFPLMFSDTANQFTVLGCNDYGLVKSNTGLINFTSGCVASGCFESPVFGLNDSCSGIGCCQASIPKGLKRLVIFIDNLSGNSSTNSTFSSNFTTNNVSQSHPNGSSYAFLAERDNFSFNFSYLFDDPTLDKGILNDVPIVLEWVVGVNKNCSVAKRDKSSYACKENTNCTDFNGASPGYRCSCLQGFEGNPYLSPGCTDIDECKTFRDICEKPEYCVNGIGNYSCFCPKGYGGHGTKSSPCIPRHRISYKSLVGLIATLGLILLLLVGWWLYTVIKRRKVIKKKDKYFKKNGGLLLQQQMSSNEGTVERTKIFTIDELEKATDNFNESRILGQGGQGTVYKGMLGEGKLVAVKKSKVVDESQQGEFINEVVILSQFNHRNIVKLLGCCLESEVPLLVYEFIPNGTLFDHIHYPSEEFPITWRMRRL